MAYAERNRALKTLLEQAFGKGKVSVKGHRGTAAGWATVKIAHAPRNQREAQELRAQVWKLIGAGKVKIPTYGYDDPGSDYGHGNCLHIHFEPSRERADAWGDNAWRHHLSAADWDALQARDEPAAKEEPAMTPGGVS
jgi:hypothetical protein